MRNCAATSNSASRPTSRPGPARASPGSACPTGYRDPIEAIVESITGAGFELPRCSPICPKVRVTTGGAPSRIWKPVSGAGAGQPCGHFRVRRSSSADLSRRQNTDRSPRWKARKARSARSTAKPAVASRLPSIVRRVQALYPRLFGGGHAIWNSPARISSIPASRSWPDRPASASPTSRCCPAAENHDRGGAGVCHLPAPTPRRSACSTRSTRRSTRPTSDASRRWCRR